MTFRIVLIQLQRVLRQSDNFGEGSGIARSKLGIPGLAEGTRFPRYGCCEGGVLGEGPVETALRLQVGLRGLNVVKKLATQKQVVRFEGIAGLARQIGELCIFKASGKNGRNLAHHLVLNGKYVLDAEIVALSPHRAAG